MSYKLLTYQAEGGTPQAGILVGNQVFDVAAVTGVPAYAVVLDILSDWDSAAEVLKGVAKKIEADKLSGIPLERVELLAPVLYPGAIYCAGANYYGHVREMMNLMKMPSDLDPRDLVGPQPWHFIKTARSSVVGHGAKVAVPANTAKFDWEAELVAVIGRTAKNVSLENALDYIAGYTISNDLSARDLGKREGVPEFSPFRFDWVGQKCFDGGLPVGPWITPADEIPDPEQLAIKLWVNDVIKQDSMTSDIIYGVAEQIAFLSSRVTLYPGDMIVTGTPAGVGTARNEFLKAGDKVRIFVEKIGELSHSVI
ncbi:fumarylacetoacetate hydrolase family protein [Ferribacterium limneticum]|uniref:fumarylacetoacetate hydrolase family protein n=1 Tax=Ferribacterium limneticum TaxID=76259 RepID=UPI001CFA6723|nr:fumarylacetoacetate hydrolase family protein [Ferribacterium limneticum]UCV17841.1 fumarylacetoacetate hydrolase family protein [Ferribacterium limneticum]